MDGRNVRRQYAEVSIPVAVALVSNALCLTPSDLTRARVDELLRLQHKLSTWSGRRPKLEHEQPAPSEGMGIVGSGSGSKGTAQSRHNSSTKGITDDLHLAGFGCRPGNRQNCLIHRDSRGDAAGQCSYAAARFIHDQGWRGCLAFMLPARCITSRSVAIIANPFSSRSVIEIG
jgi:hypothetical protein